MVRATGVRVDWLDFFNGSSGNSEVRFPLSLHFHLELAFLFDGHRGIPLSSKVLVEYQEMIMLGMNTTVITVILHQGIMGVIKHFCAAGLAIQFKIILTSTINKGK